MKNQVTYGYWLTFDIDGSRVEDLIVISWVEYSEPVRIRLDPGK